MLTEPGFQLTDGFVVTLRRKLGAAFETLGGTTPQVTPEEGLSGDQVGTKTGLSEEERTVLELCWNDCAIADLLEFFKRTNRTKFRDQLVNPLLEKGLIEMTIPDKPKSPQQRYRLTQKGKNIRVITGDAE